MEVLLRGSLGYTRLAVTRPFPVQGSQVFVVLVVVPVFITQELDEKSLLCLLHLRMTYSKGLPSDDREHERLKWEQPLRQVWVGSINELH